MKNLKKKENNNKQCIDGNLNLTLKYTLNRLVMRNIILPSSNNTLLIILTYNLPQSKNIKYYL